MLRKIVDVERANVVNLIRKNIAKQGDVCKDKSISFISTYEYIEIKEGDTDSL